MIIKNISIAKEFPDLAGLKLTICQLIVVSLISIAKEFPDLAGLKSSVQ